MNNIFNLKRFGLLVKRELILKKSFLLTSILGMIIAMYGVTLITISSGRNYMNWIENQHLVLFVVLLAVFGIIYAGMSFPYFRNKTKTMDYLLVPNSSIEKYSFELLFRIVAFLILYPVLFWITANLAGGTFNAFALESYDLSYNFWLPIESLQNDLHSTEGVLAIVSLVIFLISIPFTGAAFFSKNPIFKTAISLALLIGVSLLYGWLLDEILSFTRTRGFNPDLTPEQGFNILTGFLWLSTLVLHASAFYCIKEKEV